jgi:ParB/RepB/Spo0J family partition protein
VTITNKYKRIPLTQIEVLRDERQRQEIDVEDLLPSIKRRGVVQPIIVEERAGDRYLLIAGERRLTASIQLGLPDIPARLTADLTPIEKQILELEENVKRKDLPWKSEVAAVRRIHQLYSSIEPDWTQESTALELGYSTGVLSVILRVAQELEDKNPSVENAPGYRSAYNTIMRKDDRMIDDAMNDLLAPEPSVETSLMASTVDPEKMLGIRTPGAPLTATEARLLQRSPVVVARPESILNIDFHTWLETYTGQPFNFLHIDFPYGIDHDKSDQGGSGKQWEGYADSPDVYWKLCTALAMNLDKVLTQSGHILFWLSSDIMGETGQYETIKFFRNRAPSLSVQTVPVVWHKTDNKGILPDPKRQPRRVTETALIISRGDRFLVKPVSNAYGSPTTKEIHQSEKPEPMLRHFFQMFVDDNTRMLDPTCGSGTSLRAAESLGAAVVLGLEINPDFVEAARIALRKFRSLRAVQKKD